MPLQFSHYSSSGTFILLPVLQFYSPTSLYSSTVLHLSTVLQFSTVLPAPASYYQFYSSLLLLPLLVFVVPFCPTVVTFYTTLDNLVTLQYQLLIPPFLLLSSSLLPLLQQSTLLPSTPTYYYYYYYYYYLSSSLSSHFALPS